MVLVYVVHCITYPLGILWKQISNENKTLHDSIENKNVKPLPHSQFSLKVTICYIFLKICSANTQSNHYSIFCKYCNDFFSINQVCDFQINSNTFCNYWNQITLNSEELFLLLMTQKNGHGFDRIKKNLISTIQNNFVRLKTPHQYLSSRTLTPGNDAGQLQVATFLVGTGVRRKLEPGGVLDFWHLRRHWNKKMSC